MQAGAVGQLARQIVPQLVNHRRAGTRGGKERCAGLFAGVAQFGQIVGHDDGRRRRLAEIFKDRLAALCPGTQRPLLFCRADHLEAVRVNDVQVADNIRAKCIFFDQTDAPVATDTTDPAQIKSILVFFKKLRDADFLHQAASSENSF